MVYNFCKFVNKTNECGSPSFVSCKYNGGCHKIGGGVFKGFEITKKGPKPEITINFNEGDSYPHRYCNDWGCEWGSRAWTSKLVM